jgi:type II secretory pathway component HofQ
MKKLTQILILTTVSFGLLGCNSATRDDEGPIKLNRPEEVDSAGYSSAPAKSKDIVVETGEEVDRLVGKWPKGAETISLEEHMTPVRDVLQKLHKISRLNFVIADEVKGKVTTTLTEVPWTKALTAVLEALDLVAVLEGNVVRILNRTDWYKERAK